MGYIGVTTHLLTFDPNFLGHPSTTKIPGSRALRFHLQSHVPLRISGASATEGLNVGGCPGCASVVETQEMVGLIRAVFRDV